MSSIDVSETVQWLVGGAEGASTSSEVLARTCEGLCAAGVPVERAEAFVRTLHPHIVGRRFLWTPGAPVEVLEQSWSYLTSPEYLQSAVSTVFTSGAWARGALDGYQDLVVAPLKFLSGQVHAVTFATRRAGGFDDDQLAALRQVVPPLSRVAEILALSRTAANLLSTYVGRNAGDRILAGKIQRGDVDSIRAVLWFSDLRGFTALSSRLSPVALIGALNEVFECQVPALEQHGGEVLKFIGDGLFAIFPFAEYAGDDVVAARVEAALAAADAVFAALDEKNAGRGDDALRVGVALHIGDVAYGNIGGAARLDFTCIGAAVNIAARLEGVAASAGARLVLSDDVKRRCARPMRDLGRFALKGVADEKTAWTPV
jgi:adenylate cyclase